LIKNFKFQISNSNSGITLIEILVVVFIIALLASILVTDFPKIKRKFALTRAVYKMSQDLRRTQDMGFSGQQLKDTAENAISVKGYGIYIDLANNKKYIIYADIDDNQRYDTLGAVCGQQPPNQDCVIETIDFSQAESGVIIDRIEGTTNDQQVDINFKPPNPTITITSLSSGNRVQVIFALESDLSQERIVSVNTSGLIEIK